ncbi:MAG TPA: IPT/TIG domain-containing protein [Streptosporangiaceae bacterium]|nr:IPT/TIG domain-containing protein [Streptosporangiaceae bacterium]
MAHWNSLARRVGVPLTASVLGLLAFSAAAAIPASASTSTPASRATVATRATDATQVTDATRTTAAVGATGTTRTTGTASPNVLQAVQAAPRIPAGARPAGPVPAKTEISGEVVLTPRDNAALVRFIAQVTDKSSPLFHQYLPAGSFAARFGPAKAATAAVLAELKADGLHLSALASDHLFVRFTGRASTVEAAFHTGLESYRLADGSVGRATTAAVALPASIAPSVTAVLGLDQLAHVKPIGVLRPPASDKGKIKPATPASFGHPHGSPKACAAATKAAGNFGGLPDDQIAHAYGAFGLYGSGDLGAGQHVAIYELEPFARSDVKTFDTCYFGAAAAAKMLSRLHAIKVDGGQPAGPGSGEAILDVEDVSAIAPDATIDVYEGQSPGTNGSDYDTIDAYVAMIDADADQVISTSWGLCEQAIQYGQPGLQQAENLLFEQAAAQGQSVFAAAGDNGSDDCNTDETSSPVSGQNPVSVDDPGSQPYVVSVGGTTIDDAATKRPIEQVWNDGAVGGAGGGGISQSWAMPAWQRQSRVPGIALPGSATYTDANKVEKRFGYPANFCLPTVLKQDLLPACRLVPDVSAQADEFTGAITIYQAASGGWGTIGGTSSATPIWAALLALVNASPTCASQPATRHGVGFVSPLLYSVASSPAGYQASFNDITLGGNDVYGLADPAVFGTTKGYDLASGLGSPRLTGPSGQAGLAYYLCGAARPASRPMVTKLAPVTGSTAGGEHVTITGTGFTSGGKSDVAAIEVGTAQLKPGKFTVRSASTITATLPPARAVRPPLAPAPQDGAGPVDVIVTLKDDESSRPGPAATFEYVDTTATGSLPAITGIVADAGAEHKPGKVTIMGSGFTGATSVTFGGVKAASFTVVRRDEITATPPAYSRATACAPLPKAGVYAGENASNDICQVQVEVANAHGVSATGRILPPVQGAVVVDNIGVLVPPAGCHCETTQAPTEYDYVPAPAITSVSTSSPANFASEYGGTLVTIHGKGLDPLTIDWADFGDPASEFSQDVSYLYLTGTELQLESPQESLTTGPLRLPLSIRTLAGQSKPVTVTYAGIPDVTALINLASHKKLNGDYGAQDTGGTPVLVTGKGFAGQVIGPVYFSDAGGSSFGSQYAYAISGNTSLRTHTVAQLPGRVVVEVCTATDCGSSQAAQLYLYAPGNPRVSSVSPTSGPARGGTKVVVSGDNLGCAIAVYFGKAAARKVKPVRTLTDCASTIAVKATSPAGKAGSKVPVSVETVQSYFTGSGRSTTTARFTYK